MNKVENTDPHFGHLDEAEKCPVCGSEMYLTPGKVFSWPVCIPCRDREWMNKFTCVDCGEPFESLAPPAETREDDPDPQCGSCIEKDLDRYDEGPLDDATIKRIMAKVVLKRPPE